MSVLRSIPSSWCIFFVLLFPGLTQAFSKDLPKSGTVHESKEHSFRVETLTQQDDIIWGFDFLEDGRILFTERKGTLKIFDPKSKSVTEVKGAPKVWAKGQGGLLDVRVHPKDSSKIFLTYSEPRGEGAVTAAASATLSEASLTDFKKLFSAAEASSDTGHFGSRLEFDLKGHIYITLGDRHERPHVQDLSYHKGKTVRLNEDGTVPKDNPFVETKGARPEVWTRGHRNPQGLARHPVTGDLWLSEMGPRGGDEINLLKKAANYGWPVVTYGREYYGPSIGEGTEKKGMVQPVVHWVPSISPSGMAIYKGDAFPKWNGQIFLGNLSGQHLRRLVLDGHIVTAQEELLADEGMRIRSVRSGPEGHIYFSTDSGAIMKLVPAEASE